MFLLVLTHILRYLHDEGAGEVGERAHVKDCEGGVEELGFGVGECVQEAGFLMGDLEVEAAPLLVWVWGLGDP